MKKLGRGREESKVRLAHLLWSPIMHTVKRPKRLASTTRNTPSRFCELSPQPSPWQKAYLQMHSTRA